MTDERHDEIVRLEARIEELAVSIERCRKIILVAKLTIAAGAAWMIAVTVGVPVFDPMAMICAIAAVLGGIVAVGSNRTTAQQAAAELRTAEKLRAELIDAGNLHIVGDASSIVPARLS